MSQTLDRPLIPRSIRHKRILDVAADQPEASLEAIAAEIPSATADLVERVLDQYGDPADEATESTPEPGESAMVNENEPNLPDPENLPAKQREVLRLIAKHPDATQQELADMLDVSAPTISNRVNSIQGFDWNHRQEIVTTVFAEESDTSSEESTEMDPTTPEERAADEQLLERVSALEDQLEALDNATEHPSVFLDPELAHKVLHACMQSEAITEEEELEIVKALVR